LIFLGEHDDFRAILRAEIALVSNDFGNGVETIFGRGIPALLRLNNVRNIF